MSTIKHTDGSAWQAKKLKHTDGSAWSSEIGARFVANSSSGQYRAAGQSLSATFGSATASQNDLGVIIISSNSNARAATPAGWTESIVSYNASTFRCRQVFTKILSASESGPTFNQDGGYTTGQAWCYASMLVRGANTSSPIASNPEIYTSSTLYAVGMGGQTSPSSANSLLVAALSQGTNSNRTNWQYNEPHPQDIDSLKRSELYMEKIVDQTTAISHQIYIQKWPYAGPVNWRYFYWNTLVDHIGIFFVINPE